jgi:hypothetical protein
VLCRAICILSFFLPPILRGCRWPRTYSAPSCHHGHLSKCDNREFWANTDRHVSRGVGSRRENTMACPVNRSANARAAVLLKRLWASHEYHTRYGTASAPFVTSLWEVNDITRVLPLSILWPTFQHERERYSGGSSCCLRFSYISTTRPSYTDCFEHPARVKRVSG